jgi:flagellar biosynthesis protein FlhF
MSYQTFTGATVDEAKRLMRQALGEEGVILSTRRQPSGMVEIRAIKKGQPLFKDEGGSQKGGFFGAKTSGEPAPAPSLGGLPEPRVRNDQSRSNDKAGEAPLQSLRGDFSRNLSRGSESADPLGKRWGTQLSRHGLTKDLVAALVEAAHDYRGPGGEAGQLAFALSRTMRFAPIDIVRDMPVMLIGQTGAGKTSSAAKIAARASAQGGRIAFMSADVGRAGAVEQIQTYADALDTRFWSIEDPRQMAEIIRRERPSEGLILDTPGVSPFAAADVQAVRAYREALGAEMVLVIPASGDVEEHTDWVTAFGDIGVRRCIITKFDSSRRVGAAISACYHAGMALCYFSEAPFIADGLIDAHPDYLAHRLLMDLPARLHRPN